MWWRGVGVFDASGGMIVRETMSMNILYLYCHPLPESFHAAIRDAALAGLRGTRHALDICDLYAENFSPVMSEAERRRYHDTTRNTQGIEGYVARLRAAQVLVVQFPTWCFGPPAMLKGYFDKVFAPGVSFDMSDPQNLRPALTNLKHVVGIVTYGRDRFRAFLMGDPPRKLVTRYLPRSAAPTARASYHALYGMNVATDAQRKGFIERWAGDGGAVIFRERPMSARNCGWFRNGLHDGELHSVTETTQAGGASRHRIWLGDMDAQTENERELYRMVDILLSGLLFGSASRPTLPTHAGR